MKKRWICLYVENEIGVLARISGLFSGKSYNLSSLTVGPTEDETVSRMTIGLTGDDRTFEQVKKQLNRTVEVIKVVDCTNVNLHMKELMFVRLWDCSEQDLAEVFRISQVYGIKAVDYAPSSVILESVLTEERSGSLISLLQKRFPSRMELVRGGAVAIEGLK